MTRMVKKMLAMMLMAAVLVTYMAPIPAEAAAVTPKLNKAGITLHEGRNYNLKVVNTKKKAAWVSGNKKVVTVSSKGKVAAKKAGTAYVTVKVGKKSAKCKVIVKKHSWKTVTKPVCGKKNGLKKCSCGTSEKISFSKHKWVHHKAVGHYEEKVVGTEKVQVGTDKKMVYQCSECGIIFYDLNEYDDHAFNNIGHGGSLCWEEEIPIYETRDKVEKVWVIDSKAYDKCSNCGAKK